MINLLWDNPFPRNVISFSTKYFYNILLFYNILDKIILLSRFFSDFLVILSDEQPYARVKEIISGRNENSENPSRVPAMRGFRGGKVYWLVIRHLCREEAPSRRYWQN